MQINACKLIYSDKIFKITSRRKFDFIRQTRNYAVVGTTEGTRGGEVEQAPCNSQKTRKKNSGNSKSKQEYANAKFSNQGKKTQKRKCNMMHKNSEN